jgi:thioredoxin-related protein
VKTMTMLVGAAAWFGLCVQAAAASEKAHPLAAEGAQEVAWQKDIAEAWQATQQDGRLLLVFVTREHCYYCTKMKDGTYTSPAVARSVEAAFVPLMLDGAEQTPLLRELNVRGYPSTFVISPQAVVLDRIDGYVTPEVLANRLMALRPRPPSGKLASGP